MSNERTPKVGGESLISGEHEISGAVEEVMFRLEAVHAAREQAVNSGRQVIRMSANAIRALHRDEASTATELLDAAATMLKDMRDATAAHQGVYWAGYVQDAMKEYAEASITAAILHGRPIPTPADLHVEDGAYLNGLAEAASELRRDCLDGLRGNDTAGAERLLEQMDAVYASLVTVDYPDAITGGLRRRTDQLRAVLERTRGGVTLSIRQDRLEQALRQENSRVP